MKSYPFLINENSSGNSLRPINLNDKVYNEGWLQELIRIHPEILPVMEIESVFYPLIPIGREVSTNTGIIDNLFISHRGYLVLVETKLWRNPQAKREVLAQAMDYGSSVSKWKYEKINSIAKEYTKRFEKSEMDLIQWVETQQGPVEGGQDFFEETVSKNLKLGRFLIVIVSDKIRQPVVEMMNYINKYPHLATNMVLIELDCYHFHQNDIWPLLVVPKIKARTEIVERSVIQVTVKKDMDSEIEIQQEKRQDKKNVRKIVTLTEEAFWEILKQNAPGELKLAHDIIAKYKEIEGIEIDPTESALVVRYDIKDTGQQVSLFFINKGGHISVWPGTIGEKLHKAGFDRKLLEPYESKIRGLFSLPKNRKELARPLSQMDLNKFMEAVDEFRADLQQSEPIQ
jgi:hypothetical protein